MTKQGTMTGWLSSSKSESQIAKDRATALEQRRNNNRKPLSSRGNAKKTGGGKPKSRKGKSSYKEDSDFSGDDDSWIVNDDEVVSIEESEEEFDDADLEDEEEEDEDLVLHDDEDSDDGIDTNREELKPQKKLQSIDVDSDDSDDSDMQDSFLPKANARKSTPSKLLQQKAKAAKTRFNPTLESSMIHNMKKKRMKSCDSSLMAPALKKSKPQGKSKSSIVAKRENPEDDEELTSPCHTPKQTSNRIKTNKPRSEEDYEEVFSSDEENKINGSTSKNNRPKLASSGDKSNYFNSEHPKPNTKQTNPIVLHDSDDDDESFNKLQQNNKNRNNVLEDTPDLTKPDRKRHLNLKMSKNRMITIADSSDEDEDEDIRIALKLSLKEGKKQKAYGSTEMVNQKKEGDNIEVILEDSSDEESDQGEAYYDEEKEAASNVLRSAKQLSRDVIRTMRGWFGGSGDVQGIIVDGALSLGNLDNKKEDSTSTGNRDSDSNTCNFIVSKTEMEKAIPNVKLSNYQLVGVNWMALLNGMTCDVGTKGKKNVNGVLADEMGLGKTVQTIAFLAWLKYRRKMTPLDIESPEATDDELPPLPHLIVVPVSTLPNWIREFEKFCPEMNVIKYHGTQQEREVMKEDLREHLPKYHNRHVMKRTQLDVIVAPVSYFQKENSPDRKFLSNFKYDYLVVDEAHNLKNSKSTRYKMLDKVKTEHRLLLTGTPVQNNPQELLNMLSFIMPLFSKSGSPFEEKENHTEQMLKHFVDETAEHGDEQTAYSKLKQLFAPFVLRRRKDDVIAQLLPKKERKTIFVKLSESTRSVYKSIIQSHFNKNVNTINPGTGEHLFTNLRKCAHHPLLLRTRWNTPTEKERLIDYFIKYGAFRGEGCTNTKQRVTEEMESWNDFEIHLTALDLIQENKHRQQDLQRYVLEQKDLFCSSKFEKLRHLLPTLISEDHRILLFSSWTSCLDLLGCLMEHLGIQFQRMDGSCPSDERQRLIDRFNTDKSYSVFLLSTKACGLGINLTSADTCIIHDLDFNPFNDLQAEDRCHRIGQKKPVTVYKLIAKDSVDEDIYRMQEKKAKMNAAIMDSASSRKEKSAILKSVLETAKQEGRGSE